MGRNPKSYQFASDSRWQISESEEQPEPDVVWRVWDAESSQKRVREVSDSEKISDFDAAVEITNRLDYGMQVERERVTFRELLGSCPTLKHFADRHNDDGQLKGFLVPPLDHLSWNFVRAVLEGSKKLLLKEQVNFGRFRPSEISRLKNFNVRSLVAEMKQNRAFMELMPDIF